MADYTPPILPRKPAPDEAQLRQNAESGQWHIYVEKPVVQSITDMSPEEFAAFKARVEAQMPTEEEIRSDRWND